VHSFDVEALLDGPALGVVRRQRRPTGLIDDLEAGGQLNVAKSAAIFGLLYASTIATV
jgi:hypothetical protein